MHRIVVLAVLVSALLASGCGSDGKSGASGSGAGGDGSAATAPDGSGGSGGSSTKFGDLDSPCGPAPEGKTVTIKADEAGRGTDRLYIGVGNDRTAEAQPGVNKEMWDTSVAFAKWCNDQGGVAGIPIEPVDVDGQLIRAEAAMTTACSDTLALVGGGLVFDTQLFSGKDSSDFHKCKLIAIPGFAVSTDFADANGVVQPIPNPAYRRSAVFLHDVAELHPDEVRKSVSVYGEGVISIRINRDEVEATAKAAVPGMKFLDPISYKLIGQDFSVIAQKVIDSGATAMTFVGEPVNLSSLLSELKGKGWDGITFVETNHYDAKLFLKGDDVADGILIRTSYHMFEEGDEFPAVQQMVDIIKKDGPPDPTIAALSIQSWSSNLLFAQSVKQCVEDGSGEISRLCVLEAAKTVEDWSAGGLHAPAHPKDNLPSGCSMIVTAENGVFKRRYPESPAKDDGFHCDDALTVEITGDLGKGVVDPSLPY